MASARSEQRPVNEHVEFCVKVSTAVKWGTDAGAGAVILCP
jgi:hypothetical protein